MQEMNRYRIIQGDGYDGCIPITVYWVQVYRESFFGGEWVNVKGFDRYARAKELLDTLKGS